MRLDARARLHCACVSIAVRSSVHRLRNRGFAREQGEGKRREIVWIFSFLLLLLPPPPPVLYIFPVAILFAFSPEIALPTSCRDGKWRSDEEITKLIGHKRLYNRRYYPTAPIRVQIRLALNPRNGTFARFESVILSLTTRRAERNTRAIASLIIRRKSIVIVSLY